MHQYVYSPSCCVNTGEGEFFMLLDFSRCGGKIASAEAKPLHKHADTVCRSYQLNREKGVERVEDPSQVQGRALPESRGRASGSFTPSASPQSARKRPSVYPSRPAARCACRSSCRCRKSAGHSGNRTCPRRIRPSAAACRRGSRRRIP